MTLRLLSITLFALSFYCCTPARAQTGEILLNTSSSGSSGHFYRPLNVTSDQFGNIYFGNSSNPAVFKIDSQGVITEVFNQNSASLGIPIAGINGLVVDRVGNLYIAGRAPNPTFSSSGRADAKPGAVFKVTPSGSTSIAVSPLHQEFLGANYLPTSMVIDDQDNLYVSATQTVSYSYFGHGTLVKMNNVGQVSLLFENFDSVSGHAISSPSDLVVNSAGVVTMVGRSSNNVLQVHPNGSVVQILDENGDRQGNKLLHPGRIEIDSQDNMYVTGVDSQNVFRIDSNGSVTVVLNEDGNNAGDKLGRPADLAIDSRDNVYVSAQDTFNVFQVSPRGALHEIFDYNDIRGNPFRLAVDHEDRLIVVDYGNKVLRFNTSRFLTAHTPVLTDTIFHLPAIYLGEDQTLYDVRLQYVEGDRPGFNIISAYPILGETRLNNTPTFSAGTLDIWDAEVGASIYSLQIEQNENNQGPAFYLDWYRKIR